MRQRERSASNASLESRGEMGDSRGEEGGRKSVKKTTARGRDSPSTQFTLSFRKYEAPDLRLSLPTAALLCLWMRLRSSDLHSSDPRRLPPRRLHNLQLFKQHLWLFLGIYSHLLPCLVSYIPGSIPALLQPEEDVLRADRRMDG